MKNKNLIIGGLVLVSLAGAYYFYNKNKGGAASSAPASAGLPTMGGNLTDCKNIVTTPCLVAPCPKVCADNVELPKLYDNTANCEGQYTKYLSSLPSKLTKEYISPEKQQEIKKNWIKNNCKLKM